MISCRSPLANSCNIRRIENNMSWRMGWKFGTPHSSKSKQTIGPYARNFNRFRCVCLACASGAPRRRAGPYKDDPIGCRSTVRLSAPPTSVIRIMSINSLARILIEVTLFSCRHRRRRKDFEIAARFVASRMAMLYFGLPLIGAQSIQAPHQYT